MKTMLFLSAICSSVAFWGQTYILNEHKDTKKDFLEYCDIEEKFYDDGRGQITALFCYHENYLLFKDQ